MARSKLFRTIKPRKKIDKKIFNKKMKEGLDETGKLMKKQFEKTTRTFSKPVKFSIRTRVSPPKPFHVVVWTSNPIYKMINDGTKAHVITPTKKHGLLVFPAISRPKTTPRLISSKKGFKSKKMIFVRGPVKVKGIKARKFDTTIVKMIRPKFKKIMQKKLNEAAKASGMSMRKL